MEWITTLVKDMQRKKVGEEERKRVKCRTPFALFGSA